jgi:hypothetical protein
MSFQVDTIDLSLVSPDTGEYLTANVYYVEGVEDATGAPRPLSIGQLVMAICLQRAADLEGKIIEKMSEMEETTEKLTSLTELEQNVVDYFADTSHYILNLDSYTVTSGFYAGKTYKQVLRSEGLIDNNVTYIRSDGTFSNADILYTDFVNGIESKMDEKNSFSQQSMIELQSLTNKRDQSYDMISNILKSLNTVMTGIVNNT